MTLELLDKVPTRFAHPLGFLHWRVGLALHGRRWERSTAAEREAWVTEHAHLDGRFWLFLLGVNNSGTTLLRRVLEQHPAIRSLPREGQYYTPALQRPGDVGLSRLWGTQLERFRIDEADAERALRCRWDWLYLYEPRPGILLEKSPPHTIRARWLQANFRPARFVSLVRNPYAVCEGTRRRRGHSIEDAAHHWTAAHEILLADAPHLEHHLTVRYEELCADPEGTIERIEHHLDLEEPLDRSVLRAPLAVHNMDGAASTIRDFNAQSLARLTDEDVRTVTRIAGGVMERWGYEPLERAPAPA